MAWLGNRRVLAVGRTIVISQNAGGELTNAIDISMHLSVNDAKELRDEITKSLEWIAGEDARATYAPSVVAECIDLTSATGPMRPVDVEETAARG